MQDDARRTAAAALLLATAYIAWRARQHRRNDGTKQEEAVYDVHGRCYCGVVKFTVRATAHVIRAAYCHCESCRRAHAAPLYQVVYVQQDTQSDPAGFEITAGADYVKECRFKAAPERGSRSFCSECGSKVCNVMSGTSRVGFFPATLDETTQHALPVRFRPTLHHCPDEAVVPVFDDGLPRQPNRYAMEAAKARITT